MVLRGLLWIVNKVAEAADAESEAEAGDITTRLRELYMELEAGLIDQEMFDTREEVLLDRLDAIRPGDEEPEFEDEENDENSDEYEFDNELEAGLIHQEGFDAREEVRLDALRPGDIELEFEDEEKDDISDVGEFDNETVERSQ